MSALSIKVNTLGVFFFVAVFCFAFLTPPSLGDQRSEYGQGEEEGSHMVGSQAPVTWFMFAGGVLERSLCKKWKPSLFFHVASKSSSDFRTTDTMMEMPAINLKVSLELACLNAVVFRQMLCGDVSVVA